MAKIASKSVTPVGSEKNNIMRWWIGQVTDPKTGEWDAARNIERSKTGNDVYQMRVRVRIVGYHGTAEDLPDKDLPLAHVLGESTMSAGVGGLGSTHNLQGGESVVGFFIDDDEQQPVVMGALFRQPYVQDGKEAPAKRGGNTNFVPFTPSGPKIGKHVIPLSQKVANSPFRSGVPFLVGAVPDDMDTAKRNFLNVTGKNLEVTPKTSCENTQMQRMASTLKGIVKQIQSYQQLEGVSIDPVMGKIMDIKAEMKTAASLVHDEMTFMIRRARSFLIQNILEKLSKILSSIIPKPFEPYTGKAVQSLADIMFCNLEKIAKNLFNYILKSLENMIERVIDVPICAVENFLGDMFGQLFNVIDNSIGPLLDQLSNTLGGSLGNITSLLSKAMGMAGLVLDFLGCGGMKCTPATTFSASGGSRPAGSDNLGNIMKKAGLVSAVSPLANSIGNMVDADPTSPNCNTNVLQCGPPKVNFMGGGGSGVSGQAVVNAIGQIIGVAISDSGSGYTNPPLVTFYDSCKNGFGAGGTAVLGPVSEGDDGKFYPDPNGEETGVIRVVMVNTGQGYQPNTTETDSDGNVKEVNPDGNNSGTEESYTATLIDVIIDDTGYGYSDDANVIVDGCPDAEIELTILGGFITKAKILNAGCKFTELPDLIINSDTGAGASLIPVLEFTTLDEDQKRSADIAAQTSVITVIDCVQQ